MVRMLGLGLVSLVGIRVGSAQALPKSSSLDTDRDVEGRIGNLRQRPQQQQQLEGRRAGVTFAPNEVGT